MTPEQKARREWLDGLRPGDIIGVRMLEPLDAAGHRVAGSKLPTADTPPAYQQYAKVAVKQRSQEIIIDSTTNVYFAATGVHVDGYRWIEPVDEAYWASEAAKHEQENRLYTAQERLEGLLGLFYEEDGPGWDVGCFSVESLDQISDLVEKLKEVPK